MLVLTQISMVRVCVGLLHESKRHGRGGIDDASRSLLSWSVCLLTGVIKE